MVLNVEWPCLTDAELQLEECGKGGRLSVCLFLEAWAGPPAQPVAVAVTCHPDCGPAGACCGQLLSVFRFFLPIETSLLFAG